MLRFFDNLFGQKERDPAAEQAEQERLAQEERDAYVLLTGGLPHPSEDPTPEESTAAVSAQAQQEEFDNYEFLTGGLSHPGRNFTYWGNSETEAKENQPRTSLNRSLSNDVG